MNRKNKQAKTIGQKPYNENRCSCSSTASAGSTAPFSLCTCKGGIWLTYLDGLELESLPFIAHYTLHEKS